METGTEPKVKKTRKARPLLVTDWETYKSLCDGNKITNALTTKFSDVVKQVKDKGEGGQTIVLKLVGVIKSTVTKQVTIKTE